MTNAINSNKAYSKHRDRSTRLKCKISIRDRLRLLFGSLVFINLVAVGIGGIGLNRVRNSSPLINTIGSEQMLTYRLAYWANLRSKKTNSGERITIDVSIRDDIQNFETSLSAIHEGSKKLGLNPVSDPKVLAQLEKVADAWQIYRQKIENYLISSPQQEQEYLEQINNLTSFLTNLMDVTTRSVETQTAETAIQSQNLLSIQNIAKLNALSNKFKQISILLCLKRND